jgi:hypothetical protein
VNALLRAELLKQRSTRTSLGSLLVMLTLVLFAVVLHSFGLKASSLASHGNQMHVFGWGGLGALLRNQVAALVSLVAWLLFVEGLLFGLLPRSGRFLPGNAGAAIAGATTTGEVRPLLAPVVGALLLVLYMAATAAAGCLTTNRRDVA